MNWTFRIITGLAGVALLGGVVAAMRPHPVDVDVARVVRAPLDQKVIDDGRARVRERYTVSAPVTGTLARIDLHEGDVIEPGAVLARLLPLPSPLLDPGSRRVAEQRLASSVDVRRQAEATVSRAETALEQARRDLAKVDALVREGSVAPAQLDQATTDARMREAELSSAHFAQKVADHEIEQARAALERFAPPSSGAAAPPAPGARPSEQFEVTSPVHGQVLHVLRKSEGVVEAGTALLELGDPAALEICVDVLSQDAVAVRPGMVARVVHWGSDQGLAAKVRRVEPAAFTHTSALGVDEQRVNVLLDPEGPPDLWRPLGDGFAAEIEITVWSKPDVVQVPTSALFRAGAGWAVFAVTDGKAALRPVEVGHRGALQTEVLGGVQPDEVVISHPGASVHQGARVAAR
jgi:HlyD family secretion protein